MSSLAKSEFAFVLSSVVRPSAYNRHCEEAACAPRETSLQRHGTAGYEVGVRGREGEGVDTVNVSFLSMSLRGCHRFHLVHRDLAFLCALLEDWRQVFEPKKSVVCHAGSGPIIIMSFENITLNIPLFV